MQPQHLLGRGNLAVFIKRFRIRACPHRCDEAFKTEPVVRRGEVTHSILEEMYCEQLIAQLYLVWEVLNKAVEKDDAILMAVMETGFTSEGWCALVRMAAESNDAADYPAKKNWRAW